MPEEKIYVGLDNDHFGGMTEVGRIIRDAWVFDILPEEETCQGWRIERIQALYDKVHEAWRPYGHLVSRLPPELQEKHNRIYQAAIEKAKSMGWEADLQLEDD